MRPLLILFAALALAACEPAPDGAPAETAEPDLRVEDAWARPADTTGAARSAVYFTLRNGSEAPARLTGARADVARVAEVHQSFEEGGVMRMRPISGGVEVAPGAALAFEPGGYHVMLIDLERPLTPGARFALVLTLEPAGEREVEVEVRER